jgi:hypothetical protein
MPYNFILERTDFHKLAWKAKGCVTTLRKYVGFDVFTAVTMNCSYLVTLVLRSRIFLPWRWRRYDPPKRPFNRPHLQGATPQKTAFFNFKKTFTNYLCFIIRKFWLFFFIVYLTHVVSNSLQASNDCIRTGKLPWPNLKYHSSICLERLRKTKKNSVNIAGVPAEIRNGNF